MRERKRDKEMQFAERSMCLEKLNVRARDGKFGLKKGEDLKGESGTITMVSLHWIYFDSRLAL